MKKKLILFIAICFCLKSLAIVNGIELSIDNSAPAVQSAVFQVVSVIGIPFAIMSDILKDSNLFPEFAKPAKEQDKKKKSNSTDSKCLFTLKPKIKSKLVYKAGGIKSSFPMIQLAGTRHISASSKVVATDWELIICLLVSVFLIFLPRRSLPWAILNKHISILPNCALSVIGFFNFGGINEI